MAPHRLLQHQAALWNVPVYLAETPVVGWLVAAGAAVLASLGHNPFALALGMLILASALDYATGVATAKAVHPGRRGAYNSERAARGRREKIITVLLMLACRLMEGLAVQFGILNIASLFRWLGFDAIASAPAIQQGGILTTVVTILIAMEELASVYDHRLQNGGSRILMLEVVFATLRAVQKFVLGRVATKVSEWAGEDAADEMVAHWRAERLENDLVHRARYGTPAPRRRSYDAALADHDEEATKEVVDGPSPHPPKGPESGT
ncbi:MAG TPA: phage holin family protein [Longimicrobium sp.]|nr:phage holin family protein [Longimicrobium sp.]